MCPNSTWPKPSGAWSATSSITTLASVRAILPNSDVVSMERITVKASLTQLIHAIHLVRLAIRIQSRHVDAENRRKAFRNGCRNHERTGRTRAQHSTAVSVSHHFSGPEIQHGS